MSRESVRNPGRGPRLIDRPQFAQIGRRTEPRGLSVSTMQSARPSETTRSTRPLDLSIHLSRGTGRRACLQAPRWRRRVPVTRGKMERIWLILGRNIPPGPIGSGLGAKRAVCVCDGMSRDKGWLQIIVGREELGSHTSLQLHVRTRLLL